MNDSGTGGAQTLVEQLAKHGRDTFEVHLLVLREPGSLAIRLGQNVASIDHFGMSRQSNNILGAVRWLRKRLREIGADVVQTHLPHSDLCGFLATKHRPLIWTIHSIGYTQDDPIRTRIMFRANARMSGWVYRVVACTAQSRAFAISQGFKPQNLAVIENGIELGAAEPQREASLDPVRLVSIARWHPVKDHATLFKAVAIMSRERAVVLDCYGDGMQIDNPEVCRAIQAAGLSDSVVRLRGHTADVRPALKAATALVISSEYEALPMAGIEALANGTPVITTDVGGCPTLVANAWQSVPARNPARLADACLRLAELTSEEYQELKRTSRDLARSRFDVSRAVEAYAALYQEAVMRTRTKPA